MRKKLLFFLFILFMPFFIRAYDIENNWQSGFSGSNDDYLENIIQVDETHFVAIGNTYSNDISGINYEDNGDAILIMYDIDGNVLWNRSLSSEYNDFFTNVIVDNDKNIVVVGFSYYDDAHIFKYDINGNLLWHDQWGGEETDRFDYIFLQDDGYFVAGSTESKNINDAPDLTVASVGRDIVFVKYKFNGEIIWQDRFEFGGYYSGIDTISSTKDGDFVILFQENLEMYMVKLNKNGEIAWEKNIDGLYRYIPSDGNIYINKNDEIFLAYSTELDINGEHMSNSDAVFMKFDKDGELVFEKRFSGSEQEWFSKILLTPDNNFLLLGRTYSSDIEGVEYQGDGDIIMAKYTPNGEFLWSKSYGTYLTDTVEFISFTEDEGFLMVPKSVYVDEGDFHQREEDGIVLKYDKFGNLKWSKTYGGSDVDYFSAALLTDSGDLMVLCNSISTDIPNLPNNGGYDGIFLKYTINYDMNKVDTVNGTFDLKNNKNIAYIETTPNKGYEVDKIIIKDTNDEIIEPSKIDDVTYSVALYDDVSVEVIFKEALVNPKTGVDNIVGIVFTMLLIAISGFVIIRNYSRGCSL